MPKSHAVSQQADSSAVAAEEFEQFGWEQFDFDEEDAEAVLDSQVRGGSGLVDQGWETNVYKGFWRVSGSGGLQYDCLSTALAVLHVHLMIGEQGHTYGQILDIFIWFSLTVS